MYQRDLDVAQFFDSMLPCFINILRNGKPSFVSNSADNVSRGDRGAKVSSLPLLELGPDFVEIVH